MISVINPPNPPGAVSNKDMMGGFGQLYNQPCSTKIPPIDLPYIAAVLRENNISFDLVDCLGNDWDKNQLLSHLEQQKPTIVAVRTSTPSFEWDMCVVYDIKSRINAKIVIFGPQVSLFPMETLERKFIDAIIIGEPELTILDLATKNAFSDCDGIWYTENDKIIKNALRESINNLDLLPYPAWDLLPITAYDGGSDLMRNMKPFVIVQTSRGCPHGCAYCPYPIAQGKKLRLRSPDNVIHELMWLVNTLHVKAILFRDPEFAIQKERVRKICQGIIENRLSFIWRCETRIENLDENLIDIMAKAGCIGINMGIESSDKDVLQNVGRKAVSLEYAKKIVDFCKKKKIDTFCFFIVGLPKETRKSTLKTINYAVKLNSNFSQFTVATPYFGTKLRDWAEKNNFIECNSNSNLTGYNVAMKNENLSVYDIQELYYFANKSLEMQPKNIIRRIMAHPFSSANELKQLLNFEIMKFKLYIKR
jgi:radical SAM superfamily enzyme YgiQ (UPF0313 family)